MQVYSIQLAEAKQTARASVEPVGEDDDIRAQLTEVKRQLAEIKASDEALAKVKEELADIVAYALLLADIYDLSLEQIVLEKIAKNEQKYPVSKAKGTAKKYTEL